MGLNIAFIKVLSKFKNQFFAVPYIDPLNKDLLFHVKVPSEDYDTNKITYDVLFLIKYQDAVRYSQRPVKMFSNSPSFLFTYAYVYYHDDLIMDDFALKLPAIALTNAPLIRNPVESLGYEKSTYFAARYLIDGFCLNDNYINKHKKSLNPMQLLTLQNNIADPETIVQIYALAQEEQVKKHRKEINKERKVQREQLRKDYDVRTKLGLPKKKLFARGPRSKMTARVATKKLMNDK